jgi:hypothetical protein
MKLYASNELKSRLTHAAANGSVIAADILSELKKNCPMQEIVRGPYNFLSTKRRWMDCGSYRKIRIVFTAFNKDQEHPHFPDHNNPQAPWFPENRTILDPFTFIEQFRNLREYTSDEISYFRSAITLNSKVSVRLCSGMNDFLDAYLESNYSSITDNDMSTLHNSCMRYEDRARNAADFYANFAGAGILVASDAGNNVLGRAVVWKEAVWNGNETPAVRVSVLDRIYTSHAFVMELIREQARRLGINLRKQCNDYAHPKNFIVMNPIPGMAEEPGMEIYARLSVEMPVCRWHKKGVPYLDTFHYIHLNGTGLELANHNGSTAIASCQNTQGCATVLRFVCPQCGRIHENGDQQYCNECFPLYYIQTAFGTTMKGTPVEYKGKIFPSTLFRKGRPIPEFKSYLQIQKLFIS